MAKLTETFLNVLKIQELRQRLFYTAGLLIVVRIGAHITLPGVDASALAQAIRSQSADTLFGLYDLFVGGAFSAAAVFALVGLFLLLRFRKWVRRVLGGQSGESSA